MHKLLQKATSESPQASTSSSNGKSDKNEAESLGFADSNSEELVTNIFGQLLDDKMTEDQRRSNP